MSECDVERDRGWRTGASTAEAALDALLDRVGSTYSVVDQRFPLYADGASGVWVTTARGSWTGGFWAGLLWLRALRTGSRRDRSAARTVTAQLEHWVTADAAARGLILWYGTALAAGPGRDSAAASLRAEAARSCLNAFDQDLGILPWGSAFGGSRWLARIDGVPGTVPLLATANTRAGTEAARAHLDTHVARWRAEPVGTPAWAWAAGEWTACAQPRPGWSRGRAWLLLALADAACYIDPDYGAVAERLVDYGATPVPSAEAIQDAPPDTSAAAIEAVALLKLAATAASRHRERLRARAVEIVRHLVTAHVSGPDGPRPSGMLLDGCYDLERGLATSHELIWGDYFLALALAICSGMVAPFDT
ncbi:hypothetical protein [Nocardia sp. NPDC051463]|uniref:hypothetical protein n=1 Tax=Nocardia sp. NPDC051463 TaxID=3154845 RepID=UPI00341B761C